MQKKDIIHAISADYFGGDTAGPNPSKYLTNHKRFRKEYKKSDSLVSLCTGLQLGSKKCPVSKIFKTYLPDSKKI